MPHSAVKKLNQESERLRASLLFQPSEFHQDHVQPLCIDKTALAIDCLCCWYFVKHLEYHPWWLSSVSHAQCHTVIPFWKEDIVPDLSVKCLNMYNIVQCISMWMMFIYSALCNPFFLCGGCWIDCRLCHLLKRGCQNGEQLFTDVEECSAVSWFNCDVLLDQPTEVFVYSAVTSSWLILANCLF